MIALVRAGILGFFVLSIVFLLVQIYSRSVRRERLEKDWDGDPAHEGLTMAERDAYIQVGMAQYQTGLRRKLILLVYVVPMVTFGVIVYLVNAQ